jgi:CubicO group peptidase (beta-lactamase class C family)
VIADRLEALLQDHVSSGEALGLAWLVAEGDDVRSGAIGTVDAGGRRRIPVDGIFRIASLSKPVVSAAAFILVERGVLALDDPIERWLPELADRQVLRTPDAALDDTVPAVRPITVHDLLTSTMGIGWDFAGAAPPTVMDALDARGLATTPPQPAHWKPADEWLAGLHDVPLHHQPGEHWLYHTSYDVLGVLVARAAGQALGAFLDEAVFRPLGMTDTAFWVPPAKRERFGPCFGSEAGDGTRGVYDPADGQWAAPPPFESAGGGLVSTVADYFAFADMLRRGGGGVISPASAAAITSNQLTDAQLAASGPEPGQPVGWGCGVSVQLGSAPGGLAVGTYGWAGGLGSIWHTDPTADVVAILLTNQAILTPEPVPMIDSFRSLFAS